MLLGKILVLSSYLPSLNHCIFYLTFPCHGACLFCQYWTTGTRTCPRTSPRKQWPTGLQWDLPISYAWSTRPPSSCWVMGCSWRPLLEDILPVTFSLCSHTSLQAQTCSVKLPRKQKSFTPCPSPCLVFQNVTNVRTGRHWIRKRNLKL